MVIKILFDEPIQVVFAARYSYARDQICQKEYSQCQVRITLCHHSMGTIPKIFSSCV